MGVTGVLTFFIMIIVLLSIGGGFALRAGRRDSNNFIKGIGIMLLLLAGVTFIMTIIAVYWMLR